ncbi:RNA polymerase Rpb4 [uncultured archaeon]|nr:RNA polymerase Rpb4 [uncultured archaeon]
MKVQDERPVPLAEVKGILKRKEKEYSQDSKEMLYEQRRALEHSTQFARLSAKDTADLSKQLKELSLSLPQESIVKIVDLLPADVDDVRAIFAKERFKYSEEDIKQITELVAKYR